MKEIYNGAIFNWAQKARYVGGDLKLAFNSLKNTYFIASIRGYKSFFILNNLTIMNNRKTDSYESAFKLLKKIQYSGTYSHIFHTVFIGKFDFDKYAKDFF